MFYHVLQTDVSTFKHNKKVIKKFIYYIMDVTLITFIVTNLFTMLWM